MTSFLTEKCSFASDIPDCGVLPPDHGETNRASGEAPINIGDGEG